MKAVGFYRELCPKNPELPSLRSGGGPSLTEAARCAVAEFLARGLPVIDYTETELCVLGCGVPLVAGSSLVSSGDWIWRKDLSHYFTVHASEVPADFVASAERGVIRELTMEEAREALRTSWETAGLC